MAERPPRGYDKGDKPLPHEFFYKYDFDFSDGTKDACVQTYARTTTDAVAPSGINVNKRHASYAVDAGPVICAGSLIQFMTIAKTFVFTKRAHVTDTLPNIKMFSFKIAGCWEDTWSPVDEKTSTDIGNIIEVTSAVGKEDVVPRVSGVDLVGADNQPLSNVTMTEVGTTDYNLTTNSIQESVAFDLETYFDALHYYTNGGKLKTIVGRLKQWNMNQNHRVHNDFQKGFIPRVCQSGQPHLFYGEMIHAPSYNGTEYQAHSQEHAATAGGHITTLTHIRFNEWNEEFNQGRK